MRQGEVRNAVIATLLVTNNHRLSYSRNLVLLSGAKRKLAEALTTGREAGTRHARSQGFIGHFMGLTIISTL